MCVCACTYNGIYIHDVPTSNTYYIYNNIYRTRVFSFIARLICLPGQWAAISFTEGFTVVVVAATALKEFRVSAYIPAVAGFFNDR